LRVRIFFEYFAVVSHCFSEDFQHNSGSTFSNLYLIVLAGGSDIDPESMHFQNEGLVIINLKKTLSVHIQRFASFPIECKSLKLYRTLMPQLLAAVNHLPRISMKERSRSWPKVSEFWLYRALLVP